MNPLRSDLNAGNLDTHSALATALKIESPADHVTMHSGAVTDCVQTTAATTAVTHVV